MTHFQKIQKTVAVAIIAIGTSTGAYAQFSMPSVGSVKNLVGGGSGASAGDLSGQQDALVRGYVAANKEVLSANALMAEALGLKSDAAASAATATSLTEGATKDALEESNKAVTASTNAVAAELAKKPVLDASSKAMYSKGLLTLASGVTKFVGVGKNVGTMGTNLKSAPLTQLPKLQSAAYVVSNFPSSMGNVSDALKNAIAFAQSQDIPVPADATAALAAL